MKRKFIKFITQSIVCSLLILSSCTKLEDTNYSYVLASEFKPTSTDIGALLAPAYASWRTVLMDDVWWVGWLPTNEVCADEIVIAVKPYGWLDDGIHIAMHEHKWTSENPYVTLGWAYPYQGISSCNLLMDQIESGDIPPDNAMIAELKVLRASFYYVLCDQYGNIPIVTKFDVPEGFLPKQSTRKEVYDFLVSEITSSLPFLSEERSPATYGRFNSKWAAEALLAKIYLNAQVYSGIPQWEKCLEACDSIIGSGNYSLDPVQKNVFNSTNENSPEIIFAVPYDLIYTVNPWLLLTVSKENKATFNLQATPSGGMTAVPQFIDTYDTLDLRYTKGWLMGQQYSATGGPLKCQSGKLINKPFIIINECPGIDSTQVIHGLRPFKYEIVQDSDPRNPSYDFPLFRYADVLMMKAECLLRTGKADEAAVIVSEVRARSLKNNPDHATVTGSELLGGSSYPYGLRNHHATSYEGGADIMYGRFLDELGWEFCQEGHRRQDMIRFGVFSTKSWLSHSATNDLTKNIYPIPLEELNKNTNLKQNPGY